MHVTMIKKTLENGEPCQKCAQAEELLRRRGLWERIDEVVVADVRDPSSTGYRLAAQYGIDLAPFFVVKRGEESVVYTSVLKLIGEVLSPKPAGAAAGIPDAATLAAELSGRRPEEIVGRALELFGSELAIAFSGAEDVVLIDMAVKSGKPFSVFTLDTGRLAPETHEFIERVRKHYGVAISAAFPQAPAVEALVVKKGLFSFYEDGHGECCGIRKVEPLRRTLAGYRAWMTGQRRDQSPTRTNVSVVESDAGMAGPSGSLLKWNPLAFATLSEVWTYIRDNDVPYNALHDRGFVSIGCAPCTRAIRPGEHERAGRWWWEEATKRECGLHSELNQR
jgi:thioredoxin-dependent adenylylsulfate APS reductase